MQEVDIVTCGMTPQPIKHLLLVQLGSIVTISDANGCSDSDTINVISDPLVVTLDSTNITCNGLTDGTATVTVNGGTPIDYLWNDGQTTATAINLLAGTYTVSITDDNNCGTTGSISIAELTQLIASVQYHHLFKTLVM